MKVISKKVLSYLEPLVSWKILNLDNLVKENKYTVSKKWMSKIVLQAERFEIVGSYYHPLSSRKYAYLKEAGRKILATGNRSFAPGEDLFQGAVVSEIIYLINSLIPLDCFQFKQYEKSFEQNLYNPDSYFSLSGEDYYLNFIFRLVGSSRIKKRINHQLQVIPDSKVIFIFARRNHLERYKEFLKKEENLEDKVRLFYLPSILSSDIDLYESPELLNYLNIKMANPRRRAGDLVPKPYFDSS